MFKMRFRSMNTFSAMYWYKVFAELMCRFHLPQLFNIFLRKALYFQFLAIEGTSNIAQAYIQCFMMRDSPLSPTVSIHSFEGMTAVTYHFDLLKLAT